MDQIFEVLCDIQTTCKYEYNTFNQISQGWVRPRLYFSDQDFGTIGLMFKTETKTK